MSKSKFPSAAVFVDGDFGEAPDLHVDRCLPRRCVNHINPIINYFCGINGCSLTGALE